MQTSFITAREALLSDLNSSWTIFPMQYSLLCSDSEHWGRSRYRYGSSKDTCMLSRHRCRCRYVWCWNRYQSTLLKKQFPFHLEQVSCLMSSWEWIFSARNICCQVMFCCCCFCLTAVWWWQCLLAGSLHGFRLESCQVCGRLAQYLLETQTHPCMHCSCNQ